MQQKLAVERIISSHSRTDDWYIFSTLARYGDFYNENGITFNNAVKIMRKDGLDEMRLAKVLYMFARDTTMVNFTMQLKRYMDGGYTNYIASQPLLGVLSQIETDMPMSLLRDDYKGYYELNGFMGLSCAFFDVVWEKGEKVVRMSAVGVDQSLYHSGGSVEDGENIRDSLSRFGFYVQDPDGVANVDYEVEKKNSSKVFRLLFNLMIYTINPNDDFIEQFNKYSSKIKKRKTQKKIYTNKPFIKIGFDAEFLRLITIEEGVVKAHPRWQACGPNWSQRKLIIVTPHPRKYKKNFTEAV